MELRQYLKQVASGLESPVEPGKIFNSVFYGNDYEANAQAADEAAYPMVQIVPPLSSGVNISTVNGRQVDRWNIFIYFSDIQKNEDEQGGGMDQTAEQNDVIIERMRQAAKLYVDALNKSRLFEQITKVDFKHVSFKFDATTTGVLAFFTLVEKPGVIYC